MSYADVSALEPDAAGTPRPPSFRVLRRLLRRPVAVAAIVVIIVVYGAGILAPWIAPHGFNEADFKHTFASPSADHLLGTDRLGRDLLSRTIWAAQTTVIISAAVLLTGGLLLGVSLGLLAGYSGGRVDSFIMRAADAFYSVPTIFLLLIINTTLKPRVDSLFSDLQDLTGWDWLVSTGAGDYFLVFGALSIFGWVGMARIVRSQVLSLRQADYVLAARAAGAPTPRILFRHLLPNMTNLLVVVITLSLGATAGSEVALSWLGIGVHAPHPSFGVMIFDGSGLSNLRNHPQLMLVPAVVVGSLLLSFNLLGDVLTDVLSPRRR